MANGKPGRPKGIPKTGGRSKGTPNRVATLAATKLRDAELSAEAAVEGIRRGMLFDIADLHYREDGEELYDDDGPETGRDAYGAQVLAWRKGDVKRSWKAGDIKPLHELTEAQRWNIAGIEYVMKNAAAGDGQIDRILKLKLSDRTKYVELAAKYHSLLTEKIQLTADDALLARLDRGRERNAKPKK
jgi:hypothetical protein